VRPKKYRKNFIVTQLRKDKIADKETHVKKELATEDTNPRAFTADIIEKNSR
jgi:hypothetical protein